MSLNPTSLSPDNWVDRINEIWPGLSAEDIDLVLWNATCYPFGSVERVYADLVKARDMSGGNPRKAVDVFMAEMDAIWDEMRKREKAAGESTAPADIN